MDASPGSTEIEAYAYSRQVSMDEAAQWYQSEISSRYALFDVIRGFGTPAGLMKYFLPYNPNGYIPQDRYDEFYWFSLQENFVSHDILELYNKYAILTCSYSGRHNSSRCRKESIIRSSMTKTSTPGIFPLQYCCHVQI